MQLACKQLAYKQSVLKIVKQLLFSKINVFLNFLLHNRKFGGSLVLFINKKFSFPGDKNEATSKQLSLATQIRHFLSNFHCSGWTNVANEQKHVSTIDMHQYLQ